MLAACKHNQMCRVNINYLLLHCEFAIFRRLHVLRVNDGVIKGVRSVLRLWANPVSCSTNLWCQEG